MAERATVPCGACRACCKGDLIFLHPEKGDDPSTYLTRLAFNPVSGCTGTVLQHRPDGTCIYLGPTGCSIHDRAPIICQTFDCRRMYLRMKELGYGKRHPAVQTSVLQAGKQRLRTLKS